jgi:4'-phosphopantetheinyl transferase
VASSCPECGSGAHGRPFLLAASDEQVPHVSLSRAPGIVVVALTLAGQVGVDVEPAGGVAFDGFDDVVLHPSEQAGGPVEQAVMWVRKESLLKAAGRGLAIDMRSVRLGSPRLPPRVLSWESDAHPHGVWMFDVPDVPAGYTVSVTVIGASSPTLVTRQATWADPGRPTRP